MHVFTPLLKVEFHRIFPRDCTVGLHKAGPPGKSWEGIRVGSCHKSSLSTSLSRVRVRAQVKFDFYVFEFNLSFIF